MFNNVLLLSQSQSINKLIKWCRSRGINCLSISDQPAQIQHKEFSDMRPSEPAFERLTTTLPPDIFYTEKLIDWIDSQRFKPEWIINGQDSKDFIEIESMLGNWYNCKNKLSQTCVDFFTYKSNQDLVCKQLEIPTLPSHSSEGLCVKRDYKPVSHEFYTVPKLRWEPESYRQTANEFVQAWCDIEAIYNLHITIDAQGRWCLLECAKLDVERSMVMHEWSPWIPDVDTVEQIERILLLLKSHLTFSCRICLYQLVKLKGDALLYNLDWNARVGGDNILKRLGTEVGSFDLFSGLWDASELPDTIDFSRAYRGDTVWFHRQHLLLGQTPLKTKPWWLDPTVAWTYQIGSIDSTQLKLVKFF